MTLAILFGSLAAGRAHPNSDLDVAVIATTPLTSQARVNMMGDLALAFGRPVDLIDLSRTHCPLLQQVLTRGRLVLCKDRSQYAELISSYGLRRSRFYAVLSKNSGHKKKSMDRDLIDQAGITSALRRASRCQDAFGCRSTSSRRSNPLPSALNSS